MRIKSLLIIFWLIPVFSSAAQAQSGVTDFWQRFKSAVAKDDKNAVAGLTKFPLSMPYGVKSVRSKADFIKRYNKIMNLEANAKRCFASRNPEKTEQSTRYFVSCTFKNEPESSDNRPILYYFEKTKAGWRFTGLDNINE